MDKFNFGSRAALSTVTLVADAAHAARLGNRGICILGYHRVLSSPDIYLPQDPDIEQFRSQMRVLANYFNVLSLSDAVSALEKGIIPARAVCITFDDGYRSVHDLAMPVLRELSLPATVFVSSGVLDQNNMWNDRIIDAIRRYTGLSLDLRDLDLDVYQLDTIVNRQESCRRLVAKLKYSPQQLRDGLVSSIEKKMKIEPGPALALSSSMLSALIESNIDIGAHTVNHPILEKLPDEQAWYEISQSKTDIERLISHPVKFFAYPNGKYGVDFSQRHCRMVERAGFQGAFAGSSSMAAKDCDLYSIPRCQPWDKTPISFSVRLVRWLTAHNARSI